MGFSLSTMNILIFTFLMNAFAFTLGLSYNSMVQSVINHYVPNDDGTKSQMKYNIQYSAILTLSFVAVIFVLYKFAPDFAESTIQKSI